MGELSNDDRLGGWARALLLATVFVVVWYLLFRLAALGEVQTGASIWYLPAGWTIAFVMVFGRWAWPITVLGPVITGLIHPSGIEGAVETTETDRAQDSERPRVRQSSLSRTRVGSASLPPRYCGAEAIEC